MKIEDAIKILYAQSKIVENQGEKYVIKCYDSSVALSGTLSHLCSDLFHMLPALRLE